MTFTNTLVKLVLVKFALYAPLVTIVSVFDGFVCGFRFWPNFFAVLRFWMIFSFGFAVSNILRCPPPYDDAILAQFVVHHATDSNRTVRVE